MKQLLVIISLTFSVNLFAKEKEGKELSQGCLSSREYITTVNYLRKSKEFKLDEKQIRSIADKVSLGCSEASKRFIMITNLLVKSSLDSKSALEIAIKFASKTEAEVRTFIYIFKRSFLKNYLDLDIRTSVNVALTLSDKFDGDQKNSQETFNEILRLCGSRNGLDMPNKKCAELAANVAKKGESFKESVGKKFVHLFEYLVSRSGPNLPSFEAVKIAEELIGFGPTVYTNFLHGYKFAISKSGLNLSRNQSIEFGKKMAMRSVKTESADSK
jgi:hypothetical protein